jgi:hypothetical protein
MRRIVLAALLAAVACGGPDGPPTIPEPAGKPEEPSPPGLSVGTPTTLGPSHDSNGMRITVIGDEWGPGTCHTSGGTRTLLLENLSSVTKYSRLAAYRDDDKVCATQEKKTGKPTKSGPDEIQPGEIVSVSYTVKLPSGLPGDCALQADDCWGPGGIGDCSFVVGDTFVAETCSKECVPGDWRLKTEGSWDTCPQASTTREGCFECREDVWTNGCQDEVRPDRREVDCPCSWQGELCVTYLSNSGDDYRLEDDGVLWLADLELHHGTQHTCFPHAIDGSNLCLWWRNERIGCDHASGGPSASWHGTVAFEASCR